MRALAGVDLVVHAGDIGSPSVIEELRTVAPVRAVRGNVDRGPWASAFPKTEVVECGEHLIYVLHEPDELDLDPVAAGFSAVITGHTHQPQIEMVHGILHLNPGSAGPRRFRLPVSLAYLELDSDNADACLHAEIVHLQA